MTGERGRARQFMPGPSVGGIFFVIVLLTAGDCHCAVDFGYEALEDFAGAEFDEFGRAVGYHVFDRLSPAYGSGELRHEVGFDLGGVGVGESVDVLVDGANGCFDVGSFDCLSEFGSCGLHAGRVECSADFELEGALCTGREEFFASSVDGFYFAGDDELSGAVVVGADDDAVDRVAYLLDGFVGECDDCGHCGGFELACFLHCLSACSDEAESVFKCHRTGSDEGGEFAERVSGYHVGVEVVAECLG